MVSLKIENNKYIKIGIISFIIISAVAAISFFIIQDNFVKGWSGLIYPGIKVDSIDLSGKTKQQAMQILKHENDDIVLSRKINVKVLDKKYTIEYSKISPKYNIQEVVDQVFSYGKDLNFLESAKLIRKPQSKNYSLKFTYDQKAIKSFIVSIEKQVNVNPINAKLQMVGAGFSVTPDVKGVKLETAALEKDLISKIDGKVTPDINIEATITVPTAVITADKLTAVNTKVTSFSTEFGTGSSSERANNIRLATRAINGTCIMPGGTFSFNDVVGQRTAAKGYEAAPIIVGNQVDSGLGGGICQVSTTLYNSILKANIKSTQRTHHTLPSHYVPLGMDATVDYGNLDYKFTNTLAYPIYIQGDAEGGNIVFNVYSNSSLTASYYDITSEVYDTIKPTIEYVDDATLPKGTQVFVQQPYTGYKVRVHKKTIQGGNVINDQIVSDDYYLPVNAVIKRGTKS